MIKQTQTKMFDFSDIGLDFCVGSKNKFPQVFKKMLATGFNEQTATSVSISGNQITLSYGVAHGYVADRVLHVAASGGFNKEVYIDSVDGQSVTCTVLDADTAGLNGTINTKVASLNWNLVYEQSNVHIYKFKHIDDTDMFLRLCFQDNPSRRNCISPCLGKSVDLTSGVIIDINSPDENKTIISPGDGFKWEFSKQATASYNNYSYSDGLSLFGCGKLVGSLYHLAILSSTGGAVDSLRVNGIFPTVTHNYDVLKYPMILGESYGNIGGESDWYQPDQAYLGIGRIRCTLTGDGNAKGYGNNSILPSPASNGSSFLSNDIDNFNTTTLEPLRLFEHSTKQHLGYVYGLYLCRYAGINRPAFNRNNMPFLTVESDFDSNVVIHGMGWDGGATYLGLVIEEIKIGT